MRNWEVWYIHQTKQDILKIKGWKIPLIFLKKAEQVQTLPCIVGSSEKGMIATTMLTECK